MNNPVYTQVDLELTDIENYFTSSSIKRYSELFGCKRSPNLICSYVIHKFIFDLLS
jgi:hypothetical protein